MRHLAGLEDPALRIHERDAIALEPEPGGEIVGTEDAALKASEPIYVVKGCLPQLGFASAEVHG
jgi:hypothetical protein